MAKVALVTGANTGIGLAIAQRLMADGFAFGYATGGDGRSTASRSSRSLGSVRRALRRALDLGHSSAP